MFWNTRPSCSYEIFLSLKSCTNASSTAWVSAFSAASIGASVRICENALDIAVADQFRMFMATKTPPATRIITTTASTMPQPSSQLPRRLTRNAPLTR
jgi:hypothetical protein